MANHLWQVNLNSTLYTISFKELRIFSFGLGNSFEFDSEAQLRDYWRNLSGEDLDVSLARECEGYEINQTDS